MFEMCYCVFIFVWRVALFGLYCTVSCLQLWTPVYPVPLIRKCLWRGIWKDGDFIDAIALDAFMLSGSLHGDTLELMCPIHRFFFILVGYCKRERGYFGHSWLYCFARWRKDMYTVCFLRISCWRESCSELVSDILRSWWVYPSLPHIYHSFFGRTILIQPSSTLYQTTLISLKLRVTERKSYRFSLCNIQYVVVFGVTVPSVVKT